MLWEDAKQVPWRKNEGAGLRAASCAEIQPQNASRRLPEGAGLQGFRDLGSISGPRRLATPCRGRRHPLLSAATQHALQRQCPWRATTPPSEKIHDGERPCF